MRAETNWFPLPLVHTIETGLNREHRSETRRLGMVFAVKYE